MILNAFGLEDDIFDDLLFMGGASGGKTVEDTATGNPLTFITDVSKPLKSLLIPFTPVQSGSGDPSPQNIRSIIPWNGLTVFGGGKNLLNPAKYIFNTNTARGLTFEVQSDGSVKVTGTTESSDFGPTLSARFQLPAGTYCGYRDDGDVYIAYRKATSESGGGSTGLISPFTLDGSEWVYCNIYVRNSGTFDTIIHPQIARENTQTAYEPYKPITETDISFPSPVYGGTLDVVSGVLTVEYGIKTLDGSEDWKVNSATSSLYYIEVSDSKENTQNVVCDSYKQTIVPGVDMVAGEVKKAYTNFNFKTTYDTLDGWKSALSENNVVICYVLATPQEIQLTPAQITALVGENTIWSDADGSMTAVYLKNG